MNGKKYLVGLAAGTLLLAGTVMSTYAADPTPTPQTGTTATCQALGGTGGGALPPPDVARTSVTTIATTASRAAPAAARRTYV